MPDFRSVVSLEPSFEGALCRLPGAAARQCGASEVQALARPPEHSGGTQTKRAAIGEPVGRSRISLGSRWVHPVAQADRGAIALAPLSSVSGRAGVLSLLFRGAAGTLGLRGGVARRGAANAAAPLSAIRPNRAEVRQIRQGAWPLGWRPDSPSRALVLQKRESDLRL